VVVPEALAAIRSFDGDLCVRATTGIASVETMKHRAFHYLQKPLDLEEVLAVVCEAIRDWGLLADLETHLNIEVGRRIRSKHHEREVTLKQLANRAASRGARKVPIARTTAAWFVRH